MKRIVIFLIITFTLSWGYEFIVVYPLIEGDLSQQPSMTATFAIGVAMFIPALGVVLTRLVTREGFHACIIKPRPWRQSLPWFIVAWFGPAILIALGAVAYFLIFPNSFDPEATQFGALIKSQLAAASAPSDTSANATTGMATRIPMELPAPVSVLAISQIALGVFLGPALNIFTTFGEEWGWRGYLMPKMAYRTRIAPTLILTGLIWGLWHAPLTALGHNYGLGYPGWPITGILAMCLFCTVVGTFLSYVTIRTGSSLAAAIAHGSINALAGAATMFAIAGTNPFIGPSPTGIIGGSAFVVVALIMFVDLCKRERKGELNIPYAGSDARD